MQMLEELLYEYKLLCAVDRHNRRAVFCCNNIQCGFITASGLSANIWIASYAKDFRMLVDTENTIQDIEKKLYKKRLTV